MLVVLRYLGLDPIAGQWANVHVEIALVIESELPETVRGLSALSHTARRADCKTLRGPVQGSRACCYACGSDSLPSLAPNRVSRSIDPRTEPSDRQVIGD